MASTKTLSQQFKLAHKIARLTLAFAGSYKIAFAAALKDVRSGMYDCRSMNDLYTLAKRALTAYGAKEWNDRLYLNGSNFKMGFTGFKGSCNESYIKISEGSKEIVEFLLFAAANADALIAKNQKCTLHGASYDDPEDALSFGWSAYAAECNRGCGYNKNV